MSDPGVEEIRVSREQSLALDLWTPRLDDIGYLLTKLDESERELAAARAVIEEALAIVPFRFPDADDPERTLGDPVVWRSELVSALSQAPAAVLDARIREAKAEAYADAAAWARACSGQSADAAAEFIEEMAALEREGADHAE